jgi:sec-independent protein translocase protein TatB
MASGSPALPLFQPLRYHEAMSFADTAVLFVLALLLFGPKKLPGIARQVGKALNEFKRASNEFKAQIESEINQLEIQERQKKLEEERKILPPAVPPEGVIAATPTSGEPGSDPVPPVPPAAESVSSNPSNV